MFLRENYAEEDYVHHFHDLHNLADNGKDWCYRCRQVCTLTTEGETGHITVVSGISCLPYTTSRVGRADGTTAHAEAGLLTNAISLALRVDADEFWIENVMGLTHRESKLESKSPLQLVLEEAQL